MSNTKTNKGFTIVELLVVIVVIGILAAITIVSYSGISTRAKIASIQSDLSNASTQIKLFQVTETSNNYPTAINCPSPGATEICLKSSGGNVYTYTPSNSSNPKSFTLVITNGTLKYQITEDSSPQVFVSLAVSDPTNWLAIGTQVWAKANLNVGTMVAGAVDQTNNGGTNTVDKYCYGDSAANCTTYGGLYQWNEAMNYVTTEGAQGICPVGSHIPSDNDWKILEVQLGMAPGSAAGQVDETGYRGTDQGTQLKTGGTSGLNMPLAGSRYTDGSFNDLSLTASLWSSSESGGNAWYRYLDTAQADVGRNVNGFKAYGFSVRCLGN